MAPAVDRLRRHVEAGHDAGEHGGEVELAHVFVEPQDGLEDQAAPVGEQQLAGALELLRLALLPGDEDALLEGAVELHGGDAGAGGGAGHVLEGQLGQAGKLEQPLQVRLAHHEGVFAVDVQAAEQGGGAVLEDDAPVGKIGPGALVVDGANGVAIQGQRAAGAPGGFHQAGQQEGVAPIGEQDVRVVPPEAPGQRGEQFAGLFLAQHLDLVAQAHLQRAAMAVVGIEGAAFEPPLHHRERRQLVPVRPGVVFDRQGAHPVLALHLEPAAGQGKNFFLVAVERGQRDVAVEELQPGRPLVHPMDHLGELLQPLDPHLQHALPVPAPEVLALPPLQAHGEPGHQLGGQLGDPVERPAHIEAGDVVGVDQAPAPACRTGRPPGLNHPQHHPLGGRIQVQQPTVDPHRGSPSPAAAPAGRGFLSAARAAGKGKWRPGGSRRSRRSRRRRSTSPARTARRTPAGLPAAGRGGTWRTAPGSARSIGET